MSQDRQHQCDCHPNPASGQNARRGGGRGNEGYGGWEGAGYGVCVYGGWGWVGLGGGLLWASGVNCLLHHLSDV